MTRADISDASLQFLQDLVNTPAVPGREVQVRALLQARALSAKLFDDTRVDALGSLIGVRRPRPKPESKGAKPKRILLSAHMDQVGFLVSHVAENGTLRLHPAGAFDARALIHQRVNVTTGDGTQMKGAICCEGLPIHMQDWQELPAKLLLRHLYVDLGPSAPVEKIALGDMVTFDQPFVDLGDAVMGPGLDNRLGCWALMTALEQIDHHDSEIIAVWSSQEELGSRGIEPVSETLSPDLGISCDTVTACDVPGVSEEQAVCRLGQGVALVVADSSTLADMSLVRTLEAVAADGDVDVQRCLMEGGGQDGAYIQRSGAGVPTAVLSCPVRHMHSANEIADKTDLMSYARLLHCFLESH